MDKRYICLPKEWMNYRYHKDDTFHHLFRSQIVDVTEEDGKILMCVKTIGENNRLNSHIVMFEANPLNDAIEMYVAHTERDRLPGYPFSEIDERGYL